MSLLPLCSVTLSRVAPPQLLVFTMQQPASFLPNDSFATRSLCRYDYFSPVSSEKFTDPPLHYVPGVYDAVHTFPQLVLVPWFPL